MLRFIQFYYNTFDTNRKELAGLYREQSMLTFESASVLGVNPIVEKLVSLPFTKVQHQVTTLDAQPGMSDGNIFILVTGQLLLMDENQVDEESKPMNYTQAFQLARDPSGQYFVFNDVFKLVMRSVKNVTKGYSAVQVKVREGSQMAEIAASTFNTSTELWDMLEVIDKRLNDKGKNWRHVLKSLKVLDYCLHEGSELVVTWARQNIYLIKTLREFQYVEEDGRDVGQNVRVAAKELTSLILDEERLRAERGDRKSWKSRVTGLEEFGPQSSEASQPRQRTRERRPGNDEEDAEYRLALEASKYQEEEDRRKREGRHTDDDDDDDLAKAIKLSKEEEERRRRELEDSNANSLFDDEPAQTTTQPQYTGFNQGYQQGNPVDFFANPIEQGQMQTQPTGFMPNAYTGFQQNQPTGFQANYNNNAFGMQPGMGADPYGQQQQNLQAFQPQPTGFNPYAQQQQGQQQPQVQSPSAVEPTLPPGSNNPWATKSQQQSLAPTPTGSNNPFAQFNRPQSARPTTSSLSPLPEQKSLSTFNQAQQQQQQALLQQQQQQQQQQQFNNPQKSMNEYESKLNSLLATGDGMDTYGNTGDLRIPAQHTAPGTFANSAGSGVQRLNADATGTNPFMRQQFTGMPSISYGTQATGPPGLNGGGNPFGAQRPQQQSGNQDLIQF
ncbi:EH domain-containingbinding protein epsin 2 [Purpureocillium lavendulum]|uniref:Nuclear transport factor 2 n=1 Tax=Purpureocillium lavendulum TaxID=1247861 RepID=A0AB34FUI8_9HYPO|nr:EH domain-containingbinding protein epsin 2 [Purpureocillium lavendulum]